ncbi:M4 family metallopeptidase [Hymenobacter rubidus]|uniref:M4 family metallopeptidase n=1 Tax=Hymenobacter rubidus TaxID=1441626 RepID=UPI00191EDE7A|nr:M4 family metallopeptidase [Hymenobacter rubidus]
MTNKYSAAALLLIGTLAAHAVQAQDARRIQTKVLGEDQQPVLVQFSAEGKAAYRGMAPEQVLRQQLALTSEDQLRPARVTTDQVGYTHEKFAQYYQGIRVEHAEYTTHAKAGTIESISGDFEKISGLSTTPTLTASAALNRALAHVGATKYMWQDLAEETGLKQETGNSAASYYPTGELVIVRNELTDKASAKGQLVLAWKFNIYAQEPVSRAYIYVDARTGEVVLQDNIIKHTNVPGTFDTAYSGQRALTIGTTTGGYFLREGSPRGLGIETYNMKKGTQYARAVDFTSPDTYWDATTYNNSTFDWVAGDAHVGAEATYDYWKNVHGRNSYDDAGAKIKSYVHYSRNYENAYWDGVRMTYGDGATRFRPLTSVDVCGHEIGHAVCENTANLTYSNESGAMNEGLSDIWGASIEDYAVNTLQFLSSGAKTKNTWLIGEEIDKQQLALRSMSDPNSQSQPAYYKGRYWYTGTSDNGGVHTNSGVINYWYYLISVGKIGTNEKGVPYNITGITIDKAAKITFYMEDKYMTASSTYANARTYSIQAATILYGAGSTEVTSVTNAWDAVGVFGTSTAFAGTSSPGTPAVGGSASLSGSTSLSHELSLYPVPATNELTLTLPDNAAITSVRISDLRGAVITTARYDGNGTLDVSSLAKGMYLINVSDGQQTYRQRFVKE